MGLVNAKVLLRKPKMNFGLEYLMPPDGTNSPLQGGFAEAEDGVCFPTII